MIKALDNKGKITLSKQAIPVNEAWFIAKNNNIELAREYAAIWTAKETYNCSYSIDVENNLRQMTCNLKTKSCMNS